jgi:serine protease
MKKKARTMSRMHPFGTALALAAVTTLTIAGPASAVPPPNDSFARAQMLQVVDPVAQPCMFEGDSEIFEATRQRGERLILNQPTRKTVWFRWTPAADCGSTVTIDTIGSDFDTLLAVYSTNRLGALGLNIVAEDDDSGGSLTSSITFTPVTGTVYRVQVGGFAESEGNVLIQATQQ